MSVLNSNRIRTGATDDAAAAGELFAAAGLYQATVDEIDAGDVGRLRSTPRRALLAMPDYRACWAYSVTCANAGDIEVVTTGSYAAPTTAFFTGNDGGFDANPRYVRIPMQNWRQCAINIANALETDVELSVQVQAWLTGGSAESRVAIGTVTVPHNHECILMPHAAGPLATYAFCIPALATPCAYIILRVTPSVDPSDGTWGIFVSRS